MFKLSFDSKDYGVKNPKFYVLDLACLTSLVELTTKEKNKIPRKSEKKSLILSYQ